jgi:hypothetical protein
MTIIWSTENDRKFLILVVAAMGGKVPWDRAIPKRLPTHMIEVVKLWGPDPPTVKSLMHRMAILKKLATETESGEIPRTPKKARAIAPSASPKSAKRPHEPEFESTPRKLPKKAAKEALKFEMEEDEKQECRRIAVGFDYDDVEWKLEPDVATEDPLHFGIHQARF